MDSPFEAVQKQKDIQNINDTSVFISRGFKGKPEFIYILFGLNYINIFHEDYAKPDAPLQGFPKSGFPDIFTDSPRAGRTTFPP